MARRTSCGVVITDGDVLLLGHATGSPRWDIPKGLAEPGEEFRVAAVRELQEETGLAVAPEALRDLGVQRYMPGKDLALFVWQPEPMPDPLRLVVSPASRCRTAACGRNSTGLACSPGTTP